MAAEMAINAIVVEFHGTLLRTKPWRLMVQPENSIAQISTARTMPSSARTINSEWSGPSPPRTLARKSICIREFPDDERSREATAGCFLRARFSKKADERAV